MDMCNFYSESITVTSQSSIEALRIAVAFPHELRLISLCLTTLGPLQRSAVGTSALSSVDRLPYCFTWCALQTTFRSALKAQHPPYASMVAITHLSPVHHDVNELSPSLL